MEGVDPEGLFNQALLLQRAAGGDLGGPGDLLRGGELGASLQLPPGLAGLAGLGDPQLAAAQTQAALDAAATGAAAAAAAGGGGHAAGSPSDPHHEGGASSDVDSPGSAAAANGAPSVPPRTGSINDRKCTQVGGWAGGWVGGCTGAHAPCCSLPRLWPCSPACHCHATWCPPLQPQPQPSMPQIHPPTSPLPLALTAPRPPPAAAAPHPPPLPPPPQVLPASSSAPKYKFVVPNEYVYKFMNHLVERPFNMRDPGGKLWDCVLIQRKNKVGRVVLAGGAGRCGSCG